MAQDFAKQRNNPDGIRRKRATSKPSPSGNANWSWFFSGLMSGVIISIAAYLGILKLEENVAASSQSTQAGASPEEQPAYTFYNVLPTDEVTVNLPPGIVTPGQDSATEAPAPAQDLAAADEQRPVLYLLQAGSFQNREDAESRRARIILLNMNANVSQGVVAGRTRYRVQVGPFAGRQHAEDARDILAGNEIDSIPMLVRKP